MNQLILAVKGREQLRHHMEVLKRWADRTLRGKNNRGIANAALAVLVALEQRDTLAWGYRELAHDFLRHAPETPECADGSHI